MRTTNQSTNDWHKCRDQASYQSAKIILMCQWRNAWSVSILRKTYFTDRPLLWNIFWLFNGRRERGISKMITSVFSARQKTIQVLYWNVSIVAFMSVLSAVQLIRPVPLIQNPKKNIIITWHNFSGTCHVVWRMRSD